RMFRGRRLMDAEGGGLAGVNVERVGRFGADRAGEGGEDRLAERVVAAPVAERAVGPGDAPLGVERGDALVHVCEDGLVATDAVGGVVAARGERSMGWGGAGGGETTASKVGGRSRWGGGVAWSRRVPPASAKAGASPAGGGPI